MSNFMEARDGPIMTANGDFGIAFSRLRRTLGPSPGTTEMIGVGTLFLRPGEDIYLEIAPCDFRWNLYRYYPAMAPGGRERFPLLSTEPYNWHGVQDVPVSQRLRDMRIRETRLVNCKCGHRCEAVYQGSPATLDRKFAGATFELCPVCDADHERRLLTSAPPRPRRRDSPGKED